MLRKDTPKMARDPVAVFWIPENRDPMISDMMTTWISLQDHGVLSQSGPQGCCVSWLLPQHLQILCCAYADCTLLVLPWPRLVVLTEHVCLEVIDN